MLIPVTDTLTDPTKLILRASAKYSPVEFDSVEHHRVSIEIDDEVSTSSAEIEFRLQGPDDPSCPGYDEISVESVILTTSMPTTASAEFKGWITDDSNWFSLSSVIPEEGDRAHRQLLKAIYRAKEIASITLPGTIHRFMERPDFLYEYYQRSESPGWQQYTVAAGFLEYGVRRGTFYDAEEIKLCLSSRAQGECRTLRGLVSLLDAKARFSGLDNRTTWIHISTCVETGIKEWLATRGRDVMSLLDNIPSPPVDKMIGAVRASMGLHRLMTKSYIKRGSEVRNRLAHRWDASDPGSEMTIFYFFVAELTLFELQLELEPVNERIAAHVKDMQEEFNSLDKKGEYGKRFLKDTSSIFGIN